MLLKTLHKAQDRPIGVRVNIAFRNLLTHVLSLPEWNQVTAYTEDGHSPEAGVAEAEFVPAELGELSTRGRHLTEKCHYPWYFLLIDTDGDSRPCCWAGSRYGNLNEQTLEGIWNGPANVQMRQDFLNNHIPKGCQDKHCRVDLDHPGTME